MNKTLTRSALALAVLASASFAAHADDEETSPWSSTVGLVSDYVFDGVSQTDNGPALQVGTTYSMESGFYVGAWASNVDFAYFGDTDTNLETDWYVGYGWGDESVSFDTGLTLYKYLGTEGDSIDYDEIYFGVTFNENLTLKLWHARDYGNLDYSSNRFKVTYGVEINDSWSMPLEFTYTDPEVGDSVNHFKIGAATTVGAVGVELSYQKTNAEDGGESAAEDNLYTKGGFVLALNAEF